MLTAQRHGRATIGTPAAAPHPSTGGTATAAPTRRRPLSALDAGEWSDHLAAACVHGDLTGGLAAEAVRRTASGLMSLRDLRMVLLVADARDVWAPVREAALAHAARVPETARDVLQLHCQLEMWPPTGFTDTRDVSDGAGTSFEVVARAGLPGHEVTGPAHRGPTRQHARDRAATGLLARLAGATDPLAPTELPRPRATGDSVHGLGAEAFEVLLDERVCSDTPGPRLLDELLRRAEQGRFQHRHMYQLLFTAHGSGWHEARVAALDIVAQRSGFAESLLVMRAKELGVPGPVYEQSSRPGPGSEAPSYLTTARFDPGGGPVNGAPRSARGRRSARHRASVGLLVALTALPETVVRLPDLPDPDPPTVSPAPDRAERAAEDRDERKRRRTNALMDLNQLKMDHVIGKPEWVYERTGSAHQPAFVCTGRCPHDGRTVEARGRGGSKADARMAAASALLQLLPTAGGASKPPAGRPPTAPVPTVASSAHSAAADALRGGCALTLLMDGPADGPHFLLYRPDGRPMPAATPAAALPGAVRELVLARDHGVRRVPVAGWALPLRPAVRTLLALDGDRALHPSAQAWQAATRLGLGLVAARLVHPALGDDGRDAWYVGPLTGPVLGAVRHVAEQMPPHAHCRALPAPDGAPRIATPLHAVEAFLHVLADTLVRTPGAHALFGDGPFLSATGEPAPALRRWADDIEDRADPAPRPRLLLTVHPPSDTDAAAQHLRSTLSLYPDDDEAGAAGPVPADDVWSGRHPGADSPLRRRRVRRALRRIADIWPAAVRLATSAAPARLRLSVAEAVRLVAEAEPLAAAGFRVRWPEGLIDALTTRTVVGSRSATPESRLGLEQLIDFRWQLALNGQALTEAEMDALAEAARPLVRLRDTWVLLDETTVHRAAHRGLASLNGADALGAALSGSVSVDGATYACEPADGLAQLIAALRADASEAAPLPPPRALRARLRGYQHRGLTWLARITELGYGACLADDMGLGKTLTSIGLILHRQEAGAARPTLVVARASLVTNWVREIRRFAPRTPVVAYHGPGRTLVDVTSDTVVVTTYGILQRDTGPLTAVDWDLVLADEAQSVKNPATAAARRLRELTAAARVAVTGTPVENRLEELWAIMDWVNPGLLGTRTAFRARYGRDAERDTTGEAARRLGRVISPFLLRRLKSDPGIAPELPDKVHSRRIVRLTREQAALYEAAVRETLAAIGESAGITRHGLVVRLLTTLRQICDHPAHYLREPGPRHADEAPGFAARSAKLGALDELLDQITACDESVLIFTSYVEMGRLLHAHCAARGLAPSFLHGQTSLTERQRMVDAFQAGRVRVLILSVKAAGVGLNLTRATHVVHYDQQWNPAVEDQATDRAHRIGQDRTVTVHQLISEATLEDRIAALLHHKRALTDAVLTSGEGALADLDDDELAQLVTLGSTP
ncbi:DEAD/DEAH box helicase [Streptomyces sp. DT171]|uniref:DEAD/DEAH box helicase n=1 Tax=Streptomyces sp. DT171 TaxID=3416524 RepID=UPI003CEAFE48